MYKILNLANSITEIPYKINNYPDGQKDIVISLEHYSGPVRIDSRCNNFEDLNIIICATQALRNLGIKEIHLNVPYLLGGRSDRLFEKGGVSYLRDVLCPILRSQNYESITVLDPHNPDVLSALLPNLQYSIRESIYYNILNSDVVLVSPDAGANKKIHKIAEKAQFKGKIITCSKHRTQNGNIETHVPLFDPFKNVIIIDDIIDFGTTFRNISIQMEKMGHKGNRYLFVTHSIQKIGLDLTAALFTKVYTTNSYREITETKKINVTKVI